MCDAGSVMAVMSVASFAISAVGTITQTMAQQQAAQEAYTSQVAYNNQLIEQQNAWYQKQVNSITESYRLQNETINEQQVQINAQAVDQMSEVARKALREQAQVRVAAGESGLAGITMDRLINEPFVTAGMDIATIEANRASALKQSQLNLEGIKANTQSQLNNAYTQASKRNPEPSYNGPSWLGAGLTIAGQGLNAYSEYENTKRQEQLINKVYGVD
jgi:hypothetical protein